MKILKTQDEMIINEIVSEQAMLGLTLVDQHVVDGTVYLAFFENEKVVKSEQSLGDKANSLSSLALYVETKLGEMQQVIDDLILSSLEV